LAAFIKTARELPFPFVQLMLVETLVMLLKTILYACVDGAVYTVPLTAIFTVVAPADVSSIFPEGVPVAEFDIRT
jgi:hypothetical protein